MEMMAATVLFERVALMANGAKETQGLHTLLLDTSESRTPKTIAETVANQTVCSYQLTTLSSTQFIRNKHHE
jgi:hypothetical protein